MAILKQELDRGQTVNWLRNGTPMLEFHDLSLKLYEGMLAEGEPRSSSLDVTWWIDSLINFPVSENDVKSTKVMLKRVGERLAVPELILSKLCETGQEQIVYS